MQRAAFRAVGLDGWAYQDTHETLNTFTWGPDGWLYGCHGVFTHSVVSKPGASTAACAAVAHPIDAPPSTTGSELTASATPSRSRARFSHP